MTAKEISAYLKQVIDLEQQLMQLRAVHDELALHSYAYMMIGSKPCYKMKQTYKNVRELVEWIDKPFIMNSNFTQSFSHTEDDIKKYPALFAVAGWRKRTSSSGRVRYYTNNAPSTSSVCADEINTQESFFLDHYKKPKIDHDIVALLQEEPKPPVAVPMVKRTNRRKVWIICGLLLLILSLLFIVAQMPE